MCVMMVVMYIYVCVVYVCDDCLCDDCVCVCDEDYDDGDDM